MCVCVERVTHQKKCSLSLEIIKPPPPLRHCCLSPFQKAKTTPSPLLSTLFTPLLLILPHPLQHTPHPSTSRTQPHSPSSHLCLPILPHNSAKQHANSECQPPPACSLCGYTKTRKISKFSFRSLPFSITHSPCLVHIFALCFCVSFSALPGCEMQQQNRIIMRPARAGGAFADSRTFRIHLAPLARLDGIRLH